jgi:eukaryotic-like serine/threonine-protein kinase
MICSHCGGAVLASQRSCGKCGGAISSVAGDVAVATLTSPPVDAATTSATTVASTSSVARTPPAPDDPSIATTIAPGAPDDALTFDAQAARGQTPTDGPETALQPGMRFGRRYKLIRSLGEGGMGAVFQAWDEELAVVVAIKVFRPKSLKDPAAARDLERRFKRELLLARNVTHKNVVRIHDLGEIDGVKYITMPYVHGGDLSKLIAVEGRLAVPRAMNIARQIVAGLLAAHEAGIVHRDLKPGNILLDEEDRALITDFGIARSVTGAGGTMAGTIVGTLEYMAPEQAQGATVDHRADIYAFGLILMDMLVGRRADAHTESAMAELFARMSKTPAPVRSIDPSIPEAVDELIGRCVDPDPARRYQTTHELAADIEAVSGARQPSMASRPTLLGLPPSSAESAAPVAPATTTTVLPAPPAQKTHWRALALIAVVVALGTTIFLVRDRFSSAPQNASQVRSTSLIILPFRNASGESGLDWLGPSVANMLRTEVGQSASLRTASGDRVTQILIDMRIASDASLDPATITRLARFGSADTALWGQYVKFGSEIRIDATLQDLTTERTIALKERATHESDLPAAIHRLATSVRQNLSLPASVVKELADSAFKASSSSVQALRYYTEGLELSRRGSHLEAVKKFQAAVDEDSQFALSYSKLAESYAELGYINDAEMHSGKAVGLSEGLPLQERYQILANRARIQHDDAKAIEYYESLKKMMTGNDEVLYALATLYGSRGAYDKARAGFAQLLSRDPKYIDALVGAARVEIDNGKPGDAMEYLGRAQGLAVQRGNDEARATILRALGLNYRALNKPSEALRYYQESLEIERRLDRTPGVADSLQMIAELQDESGESDAALKNYREALNLRRPLGDKQGIGHVLNDLGVYFAARGKYNDALTQFKEALQVQREVRNQAAEARALNNIGTIYISLGSYDEAKTYLQQATTIMERIDLPSERADMLHNLAEVSIRTGEYENALDHYLKALEIRRKIGDRRGAAIESYNLGTLFEYQGRYGAAVESKADALKIFRELGDRGEWLPRVLATYGSALAQAGRFDQAQQALTEALPIARSMKSEDLIARIVMSQGDVLYYKGDYAGARKGYQEAVTIAARAKLPEEESAARLKLAKVAMRDGKSSPTSTALQQLSSEAERRGLKFESLEYSLLAAAAEFRSKRYVPARALLEPAAGQADQLGARALVAQAQHLLGLISAATAQPAEARRHAVAARQLLDAIRKDARDDQILQRSDLKPILEDVTQ